MSAPTYDRALKNEARTKIFEGLPPLKYLLTMPARERLCVNKLTEMGIILPDTQQAWVECNRAVYESLTEVAADNVHVYRDYLEHVRPKGVFDFINADMECSFGPRLAIGFECNLSRRVALNGSIAVWFTEWGRNEDAYAFHRWFEETLDTDLKWLRDGISNLLPPIEEDRENLRRSVIIGIAMFTTAMHNYRFKVGPVVSYADGMPMVAVRFDGIRPANTKQVPSFTSIYTNYQRATRCRLSQPDQKLIDLIEAATKGTHTVVLFEDDREPKWVLLAPTGNRVLARASLKEIGKIYVDPVLL